MTRLASLILFVLCASSAWADREAPPIQWSPCYQNVAASFPPALGAHYECAQVQVPLDYDQPNGAVLSLALVRVPASDPDNYRGSLFLNPGGPGGSGVNFALYFGPIAQFFVGPVANQFDIVGFDPRGIGRSTALKCFGNFSQVVQSFPPIPFPVTPFEVSFFEDAGELLDDQCTQRGNKVLEHMSTANVARDLDLLRKTLGNDHLNYLGLSYGSYLGQTYANLFPDQVGALVIDGVLDPIAWTNLEAEVPFSVALRSDVGALATLEEFFRQCDAAAPGNCALAPDSEARFYAVLERLRQGPIFIQDPATGQTFPYLYSYLVADALGTLYDPSSFPFAAQFVALLESISDPASLGLARQTLQHTGGFVNKRGFPHYVNTAEGFPGVACEDSSNPTGGYSAWWEAGQEATAEYGIFGELWAWGSFPCASWSSMDEDSYVGPFDSRPANPVLVIGNFYDPATRYEGALAANALLGGSVLLSVDEPGHTSLGISGCAGFLTGLYLENPQSYAATFAGAVCPSEGNWFDKLAHSATAEGDYGLRFRARMIEQIAYRP